MCFTFQILISTFLCFLDLEEDSVEAADSLEIDLEQEIEDDDFDAEDAFCDTIDSSPQW